jgi:HK97 family phage portal protein
LGISPLQYAASAAELANKIQANSLNFFGNNSQPSGILTADKDVKIPPAEAELFKQQWEQNFGGKNFGRVAVLGGGLKFVQLAISAADAQLIEQHRWSAEIICSAYHMPPYKVNIGQAPLNNNVQALDVQYHSQCLQRYYESIEVLMDEGLGIGDGVMIEGRVLGTEFDLANLLRMDSETQMRVLGEGAQRGLLKLNEARAVLGLEPMAGGDTAYMQEQMWPVVTLGQRPVTELTPAKPAESPQLALPPPEAPPAKGITNVSERRSDLAQRILRSADRHDRRAA